MNLDYSLLDEHTSLSDFDCREVLLNEFLKNTALLYQKRHFGITVICKELKTLVGYYTLCPASIQRELLEKNTITGPRPNPIPGFRICRLAIDKHYQGKGYGKLLFIHALKKCVNQAEQIGGSIVIIDAKNEQSRSFYEHFGFQSLPNNEMGLIQTIKYLKHHFMNAQQPCGKEIHHLAKDLCGSLHGPEDLSENPAYLEGYGQ